MRLLVTFSIIRPKSLVEKIFCGPCLGGPLGQHDSSCGAVVSERHDSSDYPGKLMLPAGSDDIGENIPLVFFDKAGTSIVQFEKGQHAI